MRLRHVYLALAILGAGLPFWPFLPWLLEHGFDLPRLTTELFSTRAGAFFGLDVLVSALVLTVFIFSESRRHRIPFAWIALLVTFLVGVSAGFPLFLYLRQRTLEAES